MVSVKIERYDLFMAAWGSVILAGDCGREVITGWFSPGTAIWLLATVGWGLLARSLGRAWWRMRRAGAVSFGVDMPEALR